MPVAFPNPPLSTNTAHLLAASFALSYVGCLYIPRITSLSFSRTFAYTPQNGQQRVKENNERWRDDPDVIRARLAAVTISTLLSCMTVVAVMWLLLGGDFQARSHAAFSTYSRLGFSYESPIALSCLVAPVLFLGPLYVCYLSSTLPFQRLWSIRWSLMPLISTWVGWRNYIVGPVTEEIVFRACMLSVYHLSGASRLKMIFLSPLWFGVAHMHHAWDVYNRYGRTQAAIQRAMLSTVLQLAYTSLFGFHCAYLFLRTGSILPPVFSHIFCNVMGLPGFGSDISRFPHRRKSIIVMYVLGVFGYVYTLWRWTAVKNSLYWHAASDPATF